MYSKKSLRRGYILMWVLFSCSVLFVALSAKTSRSLGLLRRVSFQVNREQRFLAANSAVNYIRNRISDGFVFPDEGFIFQTGGYEIFIAAQGDLFICSVTVSDTTQDNFPAPVKFSFPQ